MAKILLVEDESDERAHYRAQLETLGHIVFEAENGRQAVELYPICQPDFVLTDLVMPEMEGFETIRELKGLDPEAKILAMTRGGSNPAGAYLRIAKKFGAAEVLAKPFSAQELEAALTALFPPTPDSAKSALLTFLVLDDNAGARFLNRCLLETAFPQSKVIECESTVQAVQESGRARLDAVVTDHHLGEGDGAAFVRLLRENGASCPILMVTNSSDPKVHERAYAAGASRVFFGANTNFTGYLKTELKMG